MARVEGQARHSGAVSWRWLWTMAVLVLAGCGGGDDEPAFTLTVPADFATPLDRVTLSGMVSLPAGSEREGGTPSVSVVTCQLGTHTMSWSNAANSSTGTAYALWDCPKDIAFWSAPGIPLAAGANAVTITMTDSSRTVQGTVTITRH